MSNKAKPLPMDIIREALELDPTSKTWLRWKKRPLGSFADERVMKLWNTKYSGEEAGSLMAASTMKSYFVIKINQKKYLLHRIVYALATGSDPADMEIDHVDRNGLNNNPLNLRLATRANNCHNQKIRKSNSSGAKGVYWCKRTMKWHSRIKTNKKNLNLGRFACLSEAAAAYEKAAREIYGEFARVG